MDAGDRECYVLIRDGESACDAIIIEKSKAGYVFAEVSLPRMVLSTDSAVRSILLRA